MAGSLLGCGNVQAKQKPDASESVDAPSQLDDAPPTDAALDAPVDGTPGDGAPTGLMGLGQRCTTASDCPASAPLCINAGDPNKSFCTAVCVDNGTATTDAQGQFNQITPPPDNAACAAAFNGQTGMPVCALIGSYTPPDNPPLPNTTYTQVQLLCAVACSSNQCPTGLSCSSNGLCLPP